MILAWCTHLFPFDTKNSTHGVQVKTLHLFIAACVLTLAIPMAAAANRLRLVPNPTTFFRPAAEADVVFRAQSGGVPLPPGANGTPSLMVPQGNPQPQLPPLHIPEYNITTPPAGVVPAGGFPQSVPGVPMVGGGIQTVNGTYVDASGQPVAQQPSTWNAFSPPILPDPFAGGGVQPYAPGGGNMYGAQGGAFSTYGANGPMPFRQGWQNSMEIEWLAGSGVTGAGVNGNLSQFGVDYDLAYTGPFIPGWLFTWTNQFRLRNWDGPNGSPGLPGKAFRFGWDFELATPKTGPFSMKLGVTPSINTDFDNTFGSAAFQLDGRAVGIFQVDQYWSVVLGAGYWDRVDDRIIPYVGVVYQDDFWEWRIMYPETTVSLFLGNEALGSKWAYMRAEYHVEAYDVATAGGGNDQVELEDYRLMLGFRMDGGMYQWFMEGGWVFDRNINYGLATNGSATQNTTALLRMGWSY